MYGYGGYGMPPRGPMPGVGVDVNGDGIADYRVRPGYGGGMAMGMGPRGVGVDVNGDGIADYRVRPGVGGDVNGDGIADYRTGPRVVPGPGMGMGYGYPRYGY
jgi:hypothetical protein